MTAADFTAPLAAIPLPPVERWNPGDCGDSAMRIAADGSWFHQGERIARPELVRLFAGLLRKDDAGYVLVTPVEKLSIVVEDAPFLAVVVDKAGDGEDQRLTFTTNVGDRVVLGPEHALRLQDGIPYLHVRRGLEAKVARNVYYQLADIAVARGAVLGVWSAGAFFELGAA
ncbi:MAG: hypothetical protein RL274_652 [Pseudomonadota bacterium]|jgi:hypothetical protein